MPGQKHTVMATLPDLALLALWCAGLLLLTLKLVPLARRAAKDDARWIGVCALLMMASQVYVAGSVPMDAAVPAEWSGARQGAIIETSPASMPDSASR